MIIGIALLSAMDASAKWLMDDGIHALQLLAVRSVLITAALLVVYRMRNRLRELKPNRPLAQAVRGITGIIAPLSFFSGLSFLPLTDAMVLFFTSTFAITIISAVVLGERVGLHRWTAVVVGYFGVVIAMSPAGFYSGATAGYLLVLISSLSYAVLFTSGRWLSATESVPSLVLSYNAGVGLIACLILPGYWTPMNTTEWLVVALLALLAVSGHFAITFAFASAEASSVAPLEYTAVCWTLLFDYFFWQTLPGLATLSGALLIIACGLYVMYREQQTKQC